MKRKNTDFHIREILALNMRSERIKKGFSQESLAAAAGLHRTYVGSVERCERNVSIDNIEKIAKALGVHASSLLEETSHEAS